ncbi:hypothetical protein RI129_003292 [Pyrocoelia pectoralis]|uniref:Uncharacterized protein n=1 Tax=Pyrocoelia pectoralis TaxID=417401 RepID=A0AAN7VGQ0_9COLE
MDKAARCNLTHFIPSNFFSNSKDEYIPHEEVSHSSESSDQEIASHVTPKRARKRRRCENQWHRHQKKKPRTEGKEYVGHRNNLVHPSRKLKEYNHRCRYKCNENIPETDKQELFNNFYELPSYDLQTSFLSSCIKKEDVARTKLGAKNNRKFSTKIMLSNKRVCKAFFLKTFDITNRRFTTVCQKTGRLGICETDKRGKASSVNKIDENTRNAIIQHIKLFPRYKSHYFRKDNSETRYLSPDLNITKIKTKLELHERRAEKAVQCKKTDIESHKSANDTVVICFDLQQTLLTPLLTTSKVFYLRQLWTYNFGVHNLISGEADMFTWDETVSSRGSQEIGSCLMQYIKTLPSNITKIIAYSDSCGGQNKNKNICKLFMFLVKATQITKNTYRFHS